MTEVIDLRKPNRKGYPKSVHEVCKRFNLKPYGYIVDADVYYIVCHEWDRIALVKAWERITKKKDNNENKVEVSYYIRSFVVIMGNVVDDVIELLSESRKSLEKRQRKVLLKLEDEENK